MGKRRARVRAGSRIPDLGYYIIVTDTKETEKLYFEGLRDNLPSHLQSRLVIKVFPKTDTKNLLDRCIHESNKNPQYRIPWIIFDRDEVLFFDDLIADAHRAHVNTGWSNPCFEVWLHAYFENLQYSQDSIQCCNQFSKKYHELTRTEYEKSDSSLYRNLLTYGDEEKAITRAKYHMTNLLSSNKNSIPSQLSPATTLYKLIPQRSESSGSITMVPLPSECRESKVR